MVLPEPRSPLLSPGFWGGSWDEVAVERSRLSPPPKRGSVREGQQHWGSPAYGSRLQCFCFPLKYLIFIFF